MASLDEAIAAYQGALERLISQAPDDTRSNVMRTLIARDNLAHLMSRAHTVTADTLCRIVELDRQLKDHARVIDARVERRALESWREAIQPPTGAWWWYLDDRAAAAETKPHPLWTILAGFFITVSLSITGEIAQRFLGSGADFLGIFSTLSQALLALLAGSALTEVGRQALERGLSRLGIKRTFQPAWTTALALSVLLAVFAFRLALPAFARSYNNQGVRLQAAGRISSATEHYQRAISLFPDYAEAHYNLATAYEDVLNYDQALSEYQRAIENDEQLYRAYNNLARVYILRHDDPASALALLNAALQHEGNLDQAQQRQVRYALFKNRGWANFALRYYSLAESDLKQALALRPDGAAAHCLLAQVFEAQANPKAGLTEWEACLRYERGDVVEAQWMGLARERVSRGGAQ